MFCKTSEDKYLYAEPILDLVGCNSSTQISVFSFLWEFFLHCFIFSGFTLFKVFDSLLKKSHYALEQSLVRFIGKHLFCKFNFSFKTKFWGDAHSSLKVSRSFPICLLDTNNDLFNKLLIKSSFQGPIIIKCFCVCGRIYSSAHTLKCHI